MRHGPAAAIFALAGLCNLASGQTTQGTIAGRLSIQGTNQPLADVQIRTIDGISGTERVVLSDAAGYYSVPLVSPGVYSIRAEKDGYQPQEIQEQTVPVAARLQIDFELRPAQDVHGIRTNRLLTTGRYRWIDYFDTDGIGTRIAPVEVRRLEAPTTQATTSYVVTSQELDSAPLPARDPYSFLVLEPGVSADAPTTRGLGVSVYGQRPTASNFLLDGLENNNDLITGVRDTVAPEAVQEYRISTGNFSAEFGRTTGYVANVITRSGSNAWHATEYLYLKNEALNANDFQRNVQGLARERWREVQPGGILGGPLVRNRLFSSAALEGYLLRTEGERQTVWLPSPAIETYLDKARFAYQLLLRFPSPATADTSYTQSHTRLKQTFAPPMTVHRVFILPRLDYIRGHRGEEHYTLRLAAARLDRPDFLWTPFKDFITPLRQDTASLLLSAVHAISPHWWNEVRLGWSYSDLRFDRRWPDIPTLAVQDGTLLPGSPAAYSFQRRTSQWEVAESAVLARGRHEWKFGAGLLYRMLSGYLTDGRDGYYSFASLEFGFAGDQPSSFQAAVARAGSQALIQSDFERSYRWRQFSLFAQDSFRASSTLTLNYGIRYENFGAPHASGQVRDAVLRPSQGASFQARLLSSGPVPLDQGAALYDADNKDFAARAGFAWQMPGRQAPVLRGAYGIYYDRPFDNLWLTLQNNTFLLSSFSLRGCDAGMFYMQPISNVVQKLANCRDPGDFPLLTLYQPRLRNGYAQNFFLGLQRKIGDGLVLEVNGLGSLGRRLITNDLVNRSGATPGSVGRVDYRGSQGLSDYYALTSVVRYRSRLAGGSLDLQASYAWSHAIDNQSEALAGQYLNLGFTGSGAQVINGIAAFSVESDSRIDRASADFDQRHNAVLWMVWALPQPGGRSMISALARGWQVSATAAARSGLPYTVTAPSTGSIVNTRADLVNPLAARLCATPVAGGACLLNAAAFATPARGVQGNSGRNSFYGPGLISADLSFGKTLALPLGPESGRLTLRADLFNALNHANLNNPNAMLQSPDGTFGNATYGRRGTSTGFPALIPFRETARQVQLVLRLVF
jgi:hypothetical protein